MERILVNFEIRRATQEDVNVITSISPRSSPQNNPRTHPQSDTCYQQRTFVSRSHWDLEMATAFRLRSFTMVGRSSRCSVKFFLDYTEYRLMFCANCVAPFALRSCDSKTTTTNQDVVSCTHLMEGPIGVLQLPVASL